MSQHDNTSHTLVRQQWVAQGRLDNSQGEARPRGRIPHHGPIDADVLADMEGFIEAPPQQYPAFDVDRFLRELPSVLPQNVPAEPEDVCLICLVKHNQENPESFLTEHPCRLPCGHLIGRACIARWLRPHPDGSNANSCPIVSTPFRFPILSNLDFHMSREIRMRLKFFLRRVLRLNPMLY